MEDNLNNPQKEVSSRPREINLTITGRHFSVSQPVKDFIKKKIKKFDRYAHFIISFEIILAWDSSFAVAEGKMHCKHDVLTAQTKNTGMYLAISEMFNKLLVQLKRHEGKLRERKRLSRRIR